MVKGLSRGITAKQNNYLFVTEGSWEYKTPETLWPSGCTVLLNVLYDLFVWVGFGYWQLIITAWLTVSKLWCLDLISQVLPQTHSRWQLFYMIDKSSCSLGSRYRVCLSTCVWLCMMVFVLQSRSDRSLMGARLKFALTNLLSYSWSELYCHRAI